MEARTLESKLNYFGMEKAARRILIEEKLAAAEEIAMMTSVDVCSKLLETYEVVACESENVTIVKKEDLATYNSITKFLSR